MATEFVTLNSRLRVSFELIFRLLCLGGITWCSYDFYQLNKDTSSSSSSSSSATTVVFSTNYLVWSLGFTFFFLLFGISFDIFRLLTQGGKLYGSQPRLFLLTWRDHFFFISFTLLFGNHLRGFSEGYHYSICAGILLLQTLIHHKPRYGPTLLAPLTGIIALMALFTYILGNFLLSTLFLSSCLVSSPHLFSGDNPQCSHRGRSTL
jgi:hypothetical protein